MIGSIRPHGAPAVLLIVCLATGAVAISVLGGPAASPDRPGAPNRVPGNPGPPNILFIIMDDVGIDQLSIFNPDALDAPSTPHIDAIASAGVKFDRFWSMPECSPARASFFTGRYPFRTGVTNIILGNDLPGGQVSPYEITVPKLLDNANYTSALVGKFHLGDANPAGNRSPAALGWDYYDGILAGVPPDIDETLGGQAGTWSCGFHTGAEPRGVCWFQMPAGTIVCDDAGGAKFTGLECLAQGGIPGLNADGQFAETCDDAAGPPPNFSNTNGFYVWPKTTSHANGARDSVSRQYMTVDHTDAAIDWIQQRQFPPGNPRPWMCSVSYNSAHTPYQQPPADLTPDSLLVLECGLDDHVALRLLSNLMIEAMDQEIARLLVSTGLASWNGDDLVLELEEANTAVIIVGDNGSFYPVVKPPYNPLRAKGTCYQTGVLCPLIVAGPSGIVAEPGRTVSHMVNCVDLFELFGEIAGLDVHDAVPSSHVLDSRPLLPYLQNPDQEPIRELNFAQIGIGLPNPTTLDQIGPCVLDIFDLDDISLLSCDDILFISEDLCVANGGCWYGDQGAAPGSDCPDTDAFADCCALKQSDQSPSPTMAIVPRQVWAIRNDQYKLLMFDQACCERGFPCPPLEDGIFSKTFELYELPLDDPFPLDNAKENLLGGSDGECPSADTLDEEAWTNFQELRAALDELLASEIECYGDGNLDKQVTMQDFVGVMQNSGQTSVFDVNSDGFTDELDLVCVIENLGHVCTANDPGVHCDGTVGACCLGEGSCEKDMTQSDCESMGGVYQGDNTIQCCTFPCSLP